MQYIVIKCLTAIVTSEYTICIEYLLMRLVLIIDGVENTWKFAKKIRMKNIGNRNWKKIFVWYKTVFITTSMAFLDEKSFFCIRSHYTVLNILWEVQ